MQAAQTLEPDTQPSAARQRRALFELAREYDDLRVRLIVLSSATNKDVQAIEDVVDRLTAVRAVLKYS